MQSALLAPFLLRLSALVHVGWLRWSRFFGASDSYADEDGGPSYGIRGKGRPSACHGSRGTDRSGSVRHGLFLDFRLDM